ncbi:hypothetical protein KI387_016757, partial [Taxus chinensis]
NGQLVQNGLISPNKLSCMDSSITLDELFTAYNRMQLLEKQHIASKLLVQSLRTELELARARVQEVEFDHKTSRKEMENLLKKIAEERTLWRNQEQKRTGAAVKISKEELENERKSKRKIEIINRKLAKELADAKMDISKSMQELENERKAREMMEDVCDELAKEIGDDKAKVEELRQESDKYRQEVEEERRMLHMAEILREERVQMKLEAARLYLEDKHSTLETLKSELECFLESMRVSKVSDDVAYMRGEQLLRDAASSIRIHDITELSCQVFPGDEDSHTIEINNDMVEVVSTRDLPDSALHNLGNSAMNCPTVSPTSESTSISRRLSYSKGNIIEDEGKNEKERKEFDSATGEGNSGEEGTSDSYQETEDGRERLNDYNRENKQPSGNEADEIILQTETDEEAKVGSAILITKQKICSDSEGPLRKENTPAMHFPRSSPRRVEFCKTSRMHDRFPTPKKYSQQPVVHGARSPYKHGVRNTPDTGNPHIAREIKGFTEWPKGIRQKNLKAKLEAKVESQKAQLRHVLKLRHQKAEISRS